MTATIAPAIPQCTAKTSSGEPCKKRPIHGGTVCATHGGSTPQVRQKARVRLLEAKLNLELEARGWAPVTNPAAELADLAGETLAFKDLAREQVNLVSSWVHEGAFDTQDIHAAVKIYVMGLEQAEKILSKMASLGLTEEFLRESLALQAERPTRDQVEKLTAVLNRVLGDKRVQVDSGVARQVVVDAMTAEGLG